MMNSAKTSMDARELGLLESEMRSRSKSMVVAYLLWAFLGTLGAHWFYLGHTTRGWLYIATLIVGFITTILLIGILILFLFSLVLLIDIVRIYSETNKINAKTEVDLIAQIVAARR